MFKSNLNNFMKNIGAKLGANAPGITIGLGTGAIVVSAVMVGVDMDDAYFDERYADKVITRFLNREYEPNGAGGLFRIKDCPYDLRSVEIWYQMCWYFDSIL